MRNTLDDLDARARQARQGKIVLGAVILIGIPTWFVLSSGLGAIIALIAAAGLASVVAGGFMKFFPLQRRLPEFSAAERASLGSDLGPSRR